MSPDDTQSLLQTLAFGDYAARQTAHRALIARDEAAVPGLLAALSAPGPSLALNWEAAQILIELGTEHGIEGVLPGLLDALSAAPPGALWVAAEALSYFHSRETVEGLARLLDHADAEVRLAAAAMLATVQGGPGGIPALVAALDQSDDGLRMAAIKALRGIGDRAALPGLRSALERGVTPAAALRWAIAHLEGNDAEVLALLDDLHAAGEVGQAAREELRRVWLSEPGRVIGVLRHGREARRARAADALGLIGDPAAIPDLLAALGDAEASVRGHAAAALGRIGDRRAVGPLIGLLREPDVWLRWAAADALGSLGDPVAVLPLLEAWIGAEHELLLSAAAEAIRRIGSAEALRAALDDPRQDIRQAARYMLGRAGE